MAAEEQQSGPQAAAVHNPQCRRVSIYPADICDYQLLDGLLHLLARYFKECTLAGGAPWCSLQEKIGQETGLEDTSIVILHSPIRKVFVPSNSVMG